MEYGRSPTLKKKKKTNSNNNNKNGTTTLPETQSDRRLLHPRDTLVKLSSLFRKGSRGVSTRPRKPTKRRTADPDEKQHPCCKNPGSGQADLDTEYLGVKLVLAGTPVTVFNICSPPDKHIQLHNIKVEPQSWIVTGDFNSHSPSWGYEQLNNKEEKVENWITVNRLILINKPDDPDTFYSRTWRTTSALDLAIATDDIQGIAERVSVITTWRQ